MRELFSSVQSINTATLIDCDFTSLRIFFYCQPALGLVDLEKATLVYQEGDRLSMLLTVETDLAIRILTAVLSSSGQLFLACPVQEVLRRTIYVLHLPQRKDVIASSDITKALSVTAVALLRNLRISSIKRIV